MNSLTFIKVLCFLSVYVYFCCGNVSCTRQTDSEPFVDPRDGKLYKTVKIGDQIWMAENLNYDVGLGCYSYKQDSFAIKKYGRLYRWEAAKRAVPPGWHLPSKKEFEILLENLGGEGSHAYQQMISGSTSGFNAVFGDIRSFSGYFSYDDEIAVFWSSTDSANYTAWFLSLGRGSKKADLDFGNKNCGFSVRLIKNSDDMKETTSVTEKEKRLYTNKTDTLSDPRDGKVYKTVRIGNQVWMGENLNFDAGDYCYDYDNNPANGEKYGKLYTWKAAKRAVLPGWHLPSYAEFDELIDYLGIIHRAYSELTSAEGYRFNAVFGGTGYGKGFDGIEKRAFYWCSREEEKEEAWCLRLYKPSRNYDIIPMAGLSLNSVRLIKDKENMNEQNSSVYHKSVPADTGDYTDPRDGKVYKTVTIGSQIWMAENLNYDFAFYKVTGYCYDNNTTNCREYGKLYEHIATRFLPPPGWHIPSNDEFETLLKNISGERGDAYMDIIAGGSSGFNVKFGGLRIDKTYKTDITYKNLGKEANFWSSRGVLNVNSVKQSVNINKTYNPYLGLSIRLIKD